jgi:hypothetical protein
MGGILIFILVCAVINKIYFNPKIQAPIKITRFIMTGATYMFILL